MSTPAPAVNQIVPRPKGKAAAAKEAPSANSTSIEAGHPAKRQRSEAPPAPVIAVPTAAAMVDEDPTPQQPEACPFGMSKPIPFAKDEPQFVEYGYAKALDYIEMLGENGDVQLTFQADEGTGIDSNIRLNLTGVKWSLTEQDALNPKKKTMLLTGSIPLKQPYVEPSRLQGVFRPDNKFGKK